MGKPKAQRKSKGEVATGTGLAQVGEVLQEAGFEARPAEAQPAVNLGLPSLDAVTIETIPDLAAIAKDATELKSWLHGTPGSTSALDLIKRLGEAIAPSIGLDRESYETVKEKVGKNTTTASEIIFSKSGKVTAGARDQLLSLFVQTILGGMAHNNNALGRFTEMFYRTFALMLVPSDGKSSSVTLPVTPEGGGRWQFTSLMILPGQRDSHRILAMIKAIAKEARTASFEVKQEKVGDLRKGTDLFLDAMEKGGGVSAVFRASTKDATNPDGSKKINRNTGQPWVDFGGDIRVRVVTRKVGTVDQNFIEPIDAVGPVASNVRKMVVARVSIPAESVKTERYEAKPRLEGEKFYLTRDFHRLCRDGYLRELELAPRREESRAIRALQTVEPEALILDGAVGTTFLFRKPGKDRSGKVRSAWFDTARQRDINRLEFALTRREDDAMAVVACLKENEEFFAGCREFTQPGEKFNNLPSPLREVLHVLWATFNGMRNKGNGQPGQPAVDPADEEKFQKQMLAGAGEIPAEVASS